MTAHRHGLAPAAVLAAALAGVAPATGFAAAPWSDPAGIGPSVATITEPATPVFMAPGTALLGWRISTTEPPAGRAGGTPDRAVIARWRPDRPLVTAVVRGDLVSGAACGARCVAVLRETDPARPDGRAVLRVSLGTGPERLGTVRTLARYVRPEGTAPSELDNSRPVIAADQRGAVAVAWVEALRVQDGGPRGSRLMLAVRMPGGAFGRPRPVATAASGFVRLPQLVFHGRRSLTVAYVRGRRDGSHTRRSVESRIVGPGSRMLPAQTIGPAPESRTQLRLASAPGGRTVIAWGNVHGTIMGQADHWVVRAAIREAHARRFAAAQLLDPGTVEGVDDPGALRVAMSSVGAATVAWSAFVAGLPDPTTEVRVATATPTGRFGAAQPVAPGTLQDLAVSSGGAALLAWVAFGADGGTPVERILAAARGSAAAAFGAPATVAQIATRSFNSLTPAPAVAIDPGTGRPVVVWAQDRTAGGAHVPMSARLQLAIGPAVGT